ncbi:MAG: hypothetical protein QGH45_24100 [Myxococcota bacterium]|nr:hypothetical protein [Myxococcota bacterium]
MSSEFPELTSFGTLFIYAGALEKALESLATAAAGAAVPDTAAKTLKTAIRKHGKRATQLANMRRERLNEVVLQPLAGMDREVYLPPGELPADPTAALAILAEAEQTAARFYDDAADLGGDVLMGVDKTFRKFGVQSREWAGALTG